MKVCIILGTRPEIIKMSPVIKECQRRSINFFILHTNQHYLENLDKIFFDELKLPWPKYNLNIGSGTNGEQIGKMIIKIGKILEKEKPDTILVEGDTNTVLAGAVAASKLHIKIGHIEAGLRSFDREMPEEMNRVLTDHCSDFLFAPTKTAKKFLITEGIPKKKIFITGNTIVDAVFQNLKSSEEKINILKKLDLKRKEYFVLTAHRQENVDVKEELKGIIGRMKIIFKKYKMPIIFPIHPKTKKMIKRFRLKIPEGLKIIEPLGYLEFLQLQKNAKLIFTDSGGIQEEACILRIPCVTLRENTERPETIEMGANVLAGTTPSKILWATEKMINKNPKWKNPFGDGKSGKKILDILVNVYER